MTLLWDKAALKQIIIPELTEMWATQQKRAQTSRLLTVWVHEHLPRVPSGRVCMHRSHRPVPDPRTQRETSSAEEPIGQIQIRQLWGENNHLFIHNDIQHTKKEQEKQVMHRCVHIFKMIVWNIRHPVLGRITFKSNALQYVSLSLKK